MPKDKYYMRYIVIEIFSQTSKKRIEALTEDIEYILERFTNDPGVKASSYVKEKFPIREFKNKGLK